jgi:elongation factor G
MDQFAPALELMVEPNRAEDRGKLLAALSALAIDHPNFCFTAAAGDGNTNIGAIDELQLREIVDAVRRDHGVEIAIGKPQTAYRERITRHAEIDYTHKEQIGGQGEYARMKLVLEPTPSDYGHTFMSIRVRGILSEEFIDAVERGVRSGLAAGVLAGFPAIGMRVLLVDAAFHETDSTALTFEIAARSAVREGLRQGEPQLLEPIMRVNIATPQDCLGGILDDLKTRHGATDGRARRSRSGVVLTALVPAAKLIAYADSLKAMTGGRATFSTQFDRYAPIPSHDDPSFRPAAAARA